MAFPGGPTKHDKARADLQSMSDEDFARLSTEEKFRHVCLQMRELTQTLLELAAATKGSGRPHGG
jgi:hypothetical protein